MIRTLATLLATATFALLPAAAQQIVHATGPLPSFEVATVKPAKPDSGASAALIAKGAANTGMGAPGGGAADTTPSGEKIRSRTTVSVFFGDGPVSDRVHMTFKMKSWIAIAYGLPLSAESRVIGGPAWVNNDADRYEVNAKIDETNFAAMQKMPPAERGRQTELMEQSLLADRFHLKVHFETRDLPVYTLTLAKGGPKLTPSKPGESSLLTGVGDGQTNVLTAQAITMAQLIRSPLLRPDGRMVIDRTGLTGAYDFTLKSSMDAGTDGPSLFTAVKEQLGLQLVSTKAPLEVIVIDHIDRPDAN
jgi:bla regulator protein BlaR1